MVKFTNLDAFQAAIDLMVEVYRATSGFPASERYGLTSQMRRAAVSIVSNIAEGQGRFTIGESRQLYSHARGSLYEVEAQMVAAMRLGFLTDDAELQKHLRRAGQTLEGLIRYTRGREEAAKKKR